MTSRSRDIFNQAIRGYKIYDSSTLSSASLVESNGQRQASCGDSDYDNLEMLKKVTNDARAVGKKLRDLGYETFIKLNLTRSRIFEHFHTVLDAWKRDASEIVLFYAGHGAAIGRLYRLLGISCDVYEG